MTRTEYKRDIEWTASQCRLAGMSVEINWALPYVSVNVPGESGFWFQGQEAAELLDGVPDWVESEDWILFLSAGW